MKKFSPLTIALILSLVANALLIGLAVGNSLGRSKGGDDRGGPDRGNPDFEIARSIERVLPDEQRQQIRRVFRQAISESREQIEAKRAAQRRLREVIVAVPFDKAAVDAAFADIRATDAVLNERFQSVLSEQLSELSDEEREALRASLLDIEERFGGRRGGDGRRDGPPPPPPPPPE